MGKQDNLNSYERSTAWRCPNAPINPEIPLQVMFSTGAHYWVEKWFGESVGYAFVCKYCYDVRKFPRFTNSGLNKLRLGKTRKAEESDEQ